jgi:hypothetical protein
VYDFDQLFEHAIMHLAPATGRQIERWLAGGDVTTCPACGTACDCGGQAGRVALLVPGLPRILPVDPGPRAACVPRALKPAVQRRIAEFVRTVTPPTPPPAARGAYATGGPAWRGVRTTEMAVGGLLVFSAVVPAQARILLRGRVAATARTGSARETRWKPARPCSACRA